MLATSDIQEIAALNKETKQEIKKLIQDLNAPVMELLRVVRRFKSIGWETEPLANILNDLTKDISQIQEITEKACSMN